MKKCLKKAVSGILAAAVLCSSVVFAPMSASAAVSMTAGGWNESIYAEISGVTDDDVTAVSYSGTASGSLTGDDLTYLVRDDGTNNVRIDIPGLAAGTYSLSVTADGQTYTQSGITVSEYDRSGYAHFNYTDGVGAYNDDGTLKSDAIVIYVTEDTKNSVTLTYGSKSVSGIGNILNSRGASGTSEGASNSNNDILEDLAAANVPLVVRIVGEVVAGDSNTSDNPPSINIDGLTAYDSVDYGGSDGDNGMMARIQDAKNITIEGIGDDASINGWGIHFVCGTAAYASGYGKSIEIRNIYFQNYPEDAFGAEGQQSGSTLTAPVERVWVHNNNFGPGYCKTPTDSDKAEGDGSCDFKRGQYYTMDYNKYWDCHKTNLIGSSDSSLQYYMTLHHNYYNNCQSRGPLARQGNIHMYNNVYVGQTDYAENPRANAYIFSEYNIFDKCKNPITTASGGVAMSLNDVFYSCSGDQLGEVVTDKSADISNSCAVSDFVTNSSISYIPTDDYEYLTDASEIRANTIAYAGVMNYTTAADIDTSVISTEPTNYVDLPYAESLNSSYISSKGTQTIDNIIFNPTKTPASDSITIKEEGIVFKVNQTVYVSMTEVSGNKYSPQLSSSAGVVYATGTCTNVEIPAGTYVIQSDVYDVGTGSYKECQISYLSIVDPSGATVTNTTVTEASTESTTADTQDTTDEEETSTETTTEAGKAGDPVEMGTYVFGSSASSGTYNITTKTSLQGNMDVALRNINSGYGTLRGDGDTYISFTLDKTAEFTITYGNKAVALYNVTTGETTDLALADSPYTTTLSAGSYSVLGGDTSSNSYIYSIVLTAVDSGDTTTTTTEATTETTTTTTTTEATTTTETTTESTTADDPGSSDSVEIYVGNASGAEGGTISVPVYITGASSIANYSISLSYDSSVLTATGVTNGDVLTLAEGVLTYNAGTAGVINIAATSVENINSSGTVLCYVTFEALSTGSANITLTVNELGSADSEDITYTSGDGTVTVTEAASETDGNGSGDVNKDGSIDEIDAAIVLKIASGMLTESDVTTAGWSYEDADCDGNAGINVLDAVWILNNKGEITAAEVEFYDFEDSPAVTLNGTSGISYTADYTYTGTEYSETDGKTATASIVTNNGSKALYLNDESETDTVKVTLPLVEKSSGTVTYIATVTPSTNSGGWTMIQFKGTKADGAAGEVLGVRTDSSTNGRGYGLKVNGDNNTLVSTSTAIAADTTATLVVVVDFDNDTATLSVDGGTAITVTGVDAQSISSMVFQTATAARSLYVDDAGITASTSSSTTTESSTETTTEGTETTTAASSGTSAVSSSWTAGDSTTPSWLDLGTLTASSNSSSYTAFSSTTGSAFAKCIEIAANGTFAVTPEQAGTLKVYIAADDNNDNKGTVTAAYSDGTTAGTYSLPNRKDSTATPFEIAVSEAYANDTITFTVSYRSLLYMVE